jgi:hypothetical protein
MAANTAPIYTLLGDIQWSSSVLFSTAMASTIAAYDGTAAATQLIFTADATNGGFVQRIRAKCCVLSGTSAASVLRIWVNNGSTPGTAANNVLIGEIGLPATAFTATAATTDIEYPLNIALPPGYRLYAGIATAVTTGWAVSVIGGKY